MRKLFLLIMIAVSGFVLLAPTPILASPSYISTASSEEACDTLKNINPNSEGCGAAQGGVNKVIRVALNLLSVIAGVIAVVMVIISGFKYITAQGDATEISNAKKTLIYALAGLVVVAFAQFIVRFILARSINA